MRVPPIARSDSGLADRTLVVSSGIRDHLGEQCGGQVHLPPRHGSRLTGNYDLLATYLRLTGDLLSVTAGFGRSNGSCSSLAVGGNGKGGRQARHCEVRFAVRMGSGDVTSAGMLGAFFAHLEARVRLSLLIM